MDICGSNYLSSCVLAQSDIPLYCSTGWEADDCEVIIKGGGMHPLLYYIFTSALRSVIR